MGEQIDPIGDVPEPKARPKRAFGEECKACSRGEPILGGLGVRPCEERPCEAKAAEDKPATSEDDEELGAFAVNYLHGYLGTAITISLKPEDNAEYGAAIRARTEAKSP